MKNKKVEYNYLSPDGVTISEDNFKTIEEANLFLNEWIKGFEKQGYYSSNNGKIPIYEIAGHCKFVEFEN